MSEGSVKNRPKVAAKEDADHEKKQKGEAIRQETKQKGKETMTHHLFEGKDHASVYQKYRFTPPDEIKDVILQYLDEKKGQPHVLAVDLGCGTGQNSRLLAPYFQEMVGIDVSESQLEEARAVPGQTNITYRKGSAEELPFADGSVDLLTASSAAHWFDPPRFLAEANRVLKPGGCIALLCYRYTRTKFYYKDSGERLNHIYEEVKRVLSPYTRKQVTLGDGMLEELYTAIPFPDKKRVEGIQVSSPVSVRNLVGFFSSLSMFQCLKKEDPQVAEEFLLKTQRRFLEEMGVTSPDTEMEKIMEYYCILASKPK